ncbi:MULTISPECIES: hypothetical protein [Calothrix]|uniref:Uncharacterized protein n=2 Tax=Calothrix TaxID=1186 RepID=A0ABR8AHJ5_9CYAN|nr:MULTISPECIES: hypothetical protein [Calothrix]MBD2199505.1 hypothetical protein [Calothrix parietina FACHB-288]MBD2228115.1 hypothetical protein [Calothrix anomala FACHB-343]
MKQQYLQRLRSVSKLAKLAILGFSLVALAANQLSVLAQTRQPTNAEIKRLRQELQKEITFSKKNNSSFIQDNRTSKQKQDRESFVRAWSKVEPGLAPFLGSWTGYDLTEYIYPSNTKGRVCIIHSNEGYYGGFSTGILSNGVIQTSTGEVILKEGAYLGSALLENGRFVSKYDAPLNSPKPLEAVNKLELYDFPQKNTIIQQFNAAGCTNLKPGQQSNISINNTTSSKEIPGTVVFDYNSKYTPIGKSYRKGAYMIYIVGKKDIEQINPNLSFSLFLSQDGLIQPAFIEKGKVRDIGQDSYLLIKLIKVTKQRYILHSRHDYHEGGDDYYDIDLRNINKPIIKQIDLATAQRLGKSGRNR